MFSAIRVISFDLDDTLWPCKPVIQRAEQQLYTWLTEQAPMIVANYSIAQMRDHRLAYMRDHPHIAHDLTKVREGSLQQLMTLYGYPDSLATKATSVFRHARNRVTPYPDVLPVLTELRGRYKLVSVTNGNAEIEQTPLSGSFHKSFTAAQAGAARPDPALFQAVLDWSEAEPHTILHIGDDPARDIAPAKMLAFRTAWIQRATIESSDAEQVKSKADVSIKNLYQLSALLRPNNNAP